MSSTSEPSIIEHLRPRTRSKLLEALYSKSTEPSGMGPTEFSEVQGRREYKLALRQDLIDRGLIVKRGDRYLAVKCVYHSRMLLGKMLASIERSEAGWEEHGRTLVEMCGSSIRAREPTEDELVSGQHVAYSKDLWQFFRDAVEGGRKHPDIVELHPAILASLKHFRDHGDEARTGAEIQWLCCAALERVLAPEFKPGEAEGASLSLLNELGLTLEEYKDLTKRILVAHGDRLGSLQQLLNNLFTTKFTKFEARDLLINWTLEDDENIQKGASFLLKILPSS